MPPKLLTLSGLLIAIGLFASLFVFLDSNDQQIAVRTLLLGFGASAIAIPVGFVIATIANGRGWLAALASLFCLVGVLIPVFVQVSAWDAAFGKLGLLTNVMGDVLKPIVSRWPAAIWIHGMIAAPQVAVIFLVAMRSSSQHWEDAMRLEVSGKLAFCSIAFQKYLPVAAAAMLWTMISCAREIGVTDIYQIGTLSEQVYLGYSLGQLNAIGTAWTPEQISAAQNLGTMITFLIFAMMSIFAVVLFISMIGLIEQSDSQIPAKRSAAGVSVTVIAVVLLAMVVAVPLVTLVGRVGFFVDKVHGQPVPSWSTDSAINAIGGVFSNFRDEFVWSFLIAAIVATLLCVVAIVLAWLARTSKIAVGIMAILFGMLAATPGPSIGLFVSWLFNLIDLKWVQYLYDRTIAAPVVANSIFCLPVAILIFYFLGSRISRDQIQHATVDGVSGAKQLFHFAFVGQWRLILGAWLLIAALSFGELSATQMVLPPGMDTVPRLALGMLHAGVNESTAALAIVTLMPVLIFGLLIQICFVKKRTLRVE